MDVLVRSGSWSAPVVEVAVRRAERTGRVSRASGVRFVGWAWIWEVVMSMGVFAIMLPLWWWLWWLSDLLLSCDLGR